MSILVANFSPENLLSLRQSLNESQTVFAKRFNVSRGTIDSWEKGDTEPSGKKGQKILEVLGKFNAGTEDPNHAHLSKTNEALESDLLKIVGTLSTQDRIKVNRFAARLAREGSIIFEY